MSRADASPDPLDAIEPLLSVGDVAELLRISESGVYRLVSKGELVRVKVGGRTLFERAALRTFIADRRQAPDLPSSEPHQEAV